MWTQKLIPYAVVTVIIAAICGYVVSMMPSSPIKWKIERNNSDELRKYLEKGGSANIEFTTGGSYRSSTRPLHYAVKQGNVEMCKLLLQYGANPNLGDYNRETALMNLFSHGVESGSRDKIFDLLLPMSKISLRDEPGRTVLHYIAMYGNPEQYSLVSRMDPSLIDLLEKAGQSPRMIVEDRVAHPDMDGLSPRRLTSPGSLPK